MINYDGRTFRVVGEDGENGENGEDAADVPQARYHQDGNIVWGEFAGGHVRRGSLAGTCSPDSVLHFAYCMVYDSGEVVSGRCRSIPRLLDDGRIRLNEEWERYAPRADRGVSYLEELPLSGPVSAGRGPALSKRSEGGTDRPLVTTTLGES